MHGGHWAQYLMADESRPQVTRSLLLRVLRYARPYWGHLAGMLVTILITTALSLATPLIFRRLIDQVLPAKDLIGLVWMTVILVLIPILSSGIAVVQRRLNAAVGEGVIYDLRSSLFARFQRMSLRFFTNTRVGELMSRLNNDVVGAQNAISNTITNIITNLIQTVAILAVMLTLEWRLTLIALIVLPFLALVARRLGAQLRVVARRSMELNAQMNAHMNETLNIGGALLVKLFGREADEERRFRERAGGVRDIGVRRAVLGTSLFALLGIIGALGTALAYGLGGYLVIQGAFTIGTIVAFGSYIGSLYSALQGLVGAPVEFSTSMVSFERVFEVIDLPQDIVEKSRAVALQDVRGELEFDRVNFSYTVDEAKLLSDVKRCGRMENVAAVLSLTESDTGDRAKSDEPPEDAEGNSTAREEALDDVSFVAMPGQLVALVGPSGAGKTTLTYLIPRLYDPTEGAVRLDGHDLRDLRLNSLASAIGMVTQETYLFHDTIKTNLHLRQDERHAGRDRGRRAGRQHPQLHHGPARPLQHHRGRAWISAQRRREAAHCPCTCHPQGPEDPDPRRGHEFAR